MSKPSSLSLSAIKAATSSRSRIEDDQKAFECDALVLILSHLQSRGFLETATCLLRESMSLKLYEQADNLDLTKILKEYEAFYEMRYGRRPIFSRPVQDKYGNPDDAHGNQKHDTRSKRKQPPTKQHRNRNSALPPLNPSQEPSRKRSFREESAEEEKCDDLGVNEGVTGFAVNSPTKSKMNHAKSNGTHKTTSLKPLPNFGGDIELRSLALTIRQDIIQTSPGIKWNDIVELDGDY
jgi:katanin p60 ATPase-containing subunit A1